MPIGECSAGEGAMQGEPGEKKFKGYKLDLQVIEWCGMKLVNTKRNIQ